MFSDLECDYINPIDLCNKLNQVAQPVDLLTRTHPAQPLVCFTRKHCSRFPRRSLPALGSMGCIFAQSPSRAL